MGWVESKGDVGPGDVTSRAARGASARWTGCKVLCFAGTYGLALLSELARFVVRSRVRWYLTVGLTALGWLVQTAYLANLAWTQRTGCPVTTAFESMLVLVLDRGVDRAVPDGPLAPAGRGGAVRAAAGAGPGRGRPAGSRRGRRTGSTGAGR